MAELDSKGIIQERETHTGRDKGEREIGCFRKATTAHGGTATAQRPRKPPWPRPRTRGTREAVERERHRI